MEDPVARARRRMKLLHERVNHTAVPPEPAMQELFEDFSVILEELYQANETQRSQYEELLQTRHLLEEERKRYQELFNFAPDAYVVTNRFGAITEANRAASELLGVRQDFLIKKPLNVYIAADDQQLFTRLLHSHQSEGDVEIRLVPRENDGQEVVTWVRVSTIYNQDQAVAGLRWILRDITASKQVKVKLEASEQRFSAIFQGAHVGMCLAGLDGRLKECNRSFEEFTGYRQEELQGKDVLDLAGPPASAPDLKKAIEKMVQGSLSNIHTEQSFLSQDERTVWARLDVSLLNDPQRRPTHLLFILENITAEKEAALELAELTRRLHESAEIERIRLAQELHDGPMQDLYGAVFTLNSIQGKAEGTTHDDNLKEAQDIIKGVAGTLRSICGELRPPTLSNLGLERSIRSHAERLREQNPNLEIKLRLDEDRQKLPSNIRLVLFRVYQQAMLNVLRHAHATRVIVELKILEDQVVMRVCDNGVGFQAPHKLVELVREGHYGLAGISERVQTHGGEVHILPGEDGGACLQVMVPHQ